MARILVYSLQVAESGSKGHFNPMLRFCRQLIRGSGHEIFWSALPYDLPVEERQLISEEGIRYLASPPLPQGRQKSLADLLSLAQTAGRAHEAYEAFTLDSVRFQLETCCDQARLLKPDIVIADSMVYAAPLVAERLDLKYVVLCAGLKICENTDLGGYCQSYTPLLEKRRHLYAKLNTKTQFHHLECLSELANIVFNHPDFFTQDHLPPRTRFVGSSIDTEEIEMASFPELPRPLVLASFGSTDLARQVPRLFKMLADAASVLGVSIMVASPSLADGRDSLRITENLHAMSYVPQVAMLKQADLLVTHGGANSVGEAMHCGVPMLVLPFANDQPIQARLVERLRIGISLDPYTVTTERFTETLRQLLQPANEAHTAAKNIAIKMQAMSGTSNAAVLIGRILAGKAV